MTLRSICMLLMVAVASAAQLPLNPSDQKVLAADLHAQNAALLLSAQVRRSSFLNGKHMGSK